MRNFVALFNVLKANSTKCAAVLGSSQEAPQGAKTF